jgi:hypothetical protein
MDGRASMQAVQDGLGQLRRFSRGGGVMGSGGMILSTSLCGRCRSQRLIAILFSLLPLLAVWRARSLSPVVFFVSFGSSPLRLFSTRHFFFQSPTHDSISKSKCSCSC